MDVGVKLKGPDGGCFCCQTSQSSQWRRGPSGEKDLCNKCGVTYYQNQFSWADPVGELMARRKMLQDLKAEEERSALAAVAAALERENLEQAKLEQGQNMGSAQMGMVTENVRVQDDEEQGVEHNVHILDNKGTWPGREPVHNGEGGEAAGPGSASLTSVGDSLAAPQQPAPVLNAIVNMIERGSDVPELVRGNVVETGSHIDPEGPEPAGPRVGTRGAKGTGQSLKSESSLKKGQKSVKDREASTIGSKSKDATVHAEEPIKEGEDISVKSRRKVAKKTVMEETEEVGLEEASCWDGEGESEQAGSLPGLQEGERCCKSNNRSWRCSRTRHPGSRYCIFHIRDYVDGKLIPRKSLPANEKLRRTQSSGAEASTEALDPSSRRRSTRRRGSVREGGEGLNGACRAEGDAITACTDSEGDGRQEGYFSGDDWERNGGGGPPLLLPQQHLPMKKRFAVADREHAATAHLAGGSGEVLQRVPWENGASAGVRISASEKELAEWALAQKDSHNAKQDSQGARVGVAPGVRPPKLEGTTDQGPNGTAAAAADHAPVRMTLGELPDAFLRAQERGGAHLSDAGGREQAHRPESSMSPKGESLRRVGMIVEALAGGLDNFGYLEDSPAKAQEGLVQKPEKQTEKEEKSAGGPKVKVEEGEPKGEFKRCIMSGGTGWKCGRPRIEESKYCQYHFELRRKQRQNSGARAAKGAGKRRTPGLKRSTRGTPKASERADSPNPNGRKRRLPKPEPEDDRGVLPFLSLEFRLQKRTRTKKAVRPHTAVDRLLLAAKVRREDSLELLSDHQAGRQQLRCFKVKVSDLEVADFSEMDEDEAGAHEALTQMLAASTHQGPSGSDVLRKEENGPERSTGACAELGKKDSADEAAALTTTSPARLANASSPGPPSAACHALKRLVAAEGAGESDGAEPKRSRSEAHEARRLTWELHTAEEARVQLEAEGAQVARELKQELASRAKLEMRLGELAGSEEAKEKPEVVALREEVVALRKDLGEERGKNGTLRKQIRQLSEQLEAQERQFLGHQADLEVLEAKHKDLEADIAALLLEKHALEDETSLLKKGIHCFVCHAQYANNALDPCGCRVCSSCLILPPSGQSNGISNSHTSAATQCPACHGLAKGGVKLLKPGPAGSELDQCYRMGQQYPSK